MRAVLLLSFAFALLMPPLACQQSELKRGASANTQSGLTGDSTRNLDATRTIKGENVRLEGQNENSLQEPEGRRVFAQGDQRSVADRDALKRLRGGAEVSKENYTVKKADLEEVASRTTYRFDREKLRDAWEKLHEQSKLRRGASSDAQSGLTGGSFRNPGANQSTEGNKTRVQKDQQENTRPEPKESGDRNASAQGNQSEANHDTTNQSGERTDVNLEEDEEGAGDGENVPSQNGSQIKINRQRLRAARKKIRELSREEKQHKWPEKFDNQAAERIEQHMDKRGWSDFSFGERSAGNEEASSSSGSEKDGNR